MIKGGNIGAMDTLYTVQYPVITYNSLTNEQIKGWAGTSTIWAEELVDEISKEKFEADQQVALDILTLRIRYLSTLSEVMRLVRGTDIFYITGIKRVERQKFMIVSAEKRDNA